MQPCDVGLFPALKHNYHISHVKWSTSHPEKNLDKNSFTELFKMAWEITVQSSLAVNAFKHSGLYPFGYKFIDQTRITKSLVSKLLLFGAMWIL